MGQLMGVMLEGFFGKNPKLDAGIAHAFGLKPPTAPAAAPAGKLTQANSATVSAAAPASTPTLQQILAGTGTSKPAAGVTGGSAGRSAAPPSALGTGGSGWPPNTVNG